MKKIFISAALVASAAAFAQTGKVGVNNNAPAATLDIQPNTANLTGTTNEGVLIPRLTAARVTAIATPVEGTLVYVTDAPSGTLFSDTTKGFYYYDSAATQWKKMGSGASGAATNIYTADGTLTAARTVTQNNQNLTFNTGTAANITNGNLKTDAFFLKTPVITTAAAYTATATDAIIITKAGAANTITLPDATSNIGRVFIISNMNTAASSLSLASASPIIGTSTFQQYRGKMVVSDGTEWVVISYN